MYFAWLQRDVDFDFVHVESDFSDGGSDEGGPRRSVVDVAEEFAKFTAIMVPYSDALTDRYSERKEKLKDITLIFVNICLILMMS